MQFTYYGDLLGISANYNLSPEAARNKLDIFYETAFSVLKEYCVGQATNIDVLMFSDSLLISGSYSLSLLEKIRNLYVSLIRKGILLRGSMVEGKLDFESRRQIDNFRKMLPTNNVLAEAHALEQTQKGSRFLLHQLLAKKMFGENNMWLTQEGYIWNKNLSYQEDRILRRISPTPDNKSYELLYFITDNLIIEEDYNNIRENLKEVIRMVVPRIAEHYKETINLIDRCQHRFPLRKEGKTENG